MNPAPNDLRFAVIHVGARLHYGAPAALQQAGLLQRLYTDAHADCLGARLLGPLALVPGAKGIRRLLSRYIPASIPREKVHSWMWPSLQIEWFNRQNPTLRKRARAHHEQCVGGHWLARQAIADNFGGANALYVHPCVGTDAIREAKRRGMYVVLEAISHPFNKLVEKAEYERFGLSGPEPEAELRDNIAFFKEEALLADLILAASPYVREGLLELGLSPARIAVVPYGLDSAFFEAPAKPAPGRVLYVGNVGYLKGVPYLAEAARRLQAEGFAGEVRVVGPHDGRMIQRPEFAGPTYVGQVPRAEVKSEFLSADLFVFPTLSDGFGVVLLEAMAAGLPLIATAHCAGVVQERGNGTVVAVRDAEGLARRVREITQDRSLRQRMSAAARDTATKYSLRTYHEGLLAALCIMHHSVPPRPLNHHP
jgi:glycosyltransferase involved in cell wall biosynthesis